VKAYPLFLVFFSLLTFPILGNKNGTIVVPLERVKNLPSIYFSATSSCGAFEEDYKQTLVDILQKDIEESFHFDLTMGQIEIEPMIHTTLGKQPKELKAFQSDFVLLVKIDRKNFIMKLYEPKFHTTVNVGSCELSGDVEIDRCLMHELFDALHEKVFQQPGIASSKILFCKKTADIEKEWISDIYEINYDGSGLRKLTSSQNYLICPQMIPKTRKKNAYEYVYVSYEEGIPKIYKAHSLMGNARPFLSLRGNQLLPSFSPSGDKVAFICDASGKTDLFFQQHIPAKGLIGKPIQLFSKNNATQASSSFSPCGSKIAFVSDKDGAPKTYILDLMEAVRFQKTPSVKLLSSHHKETTCPSWSIDGKKIAFCAMVEGFRQIWVMDLEKKVEAPITSGAIDKENPCWAADSIHLVYNTTGKESQIYVIDIVNQKPVKITDGEGIAHFPSWEQR
jgi:TolB protein